MYHNVKSSWRQNFRHVVTKFVMTSKTSTTHHNVKNTSKVRKVRHDVKKFVIVKNTQWRHDIKNMRWHQKVRYNIKNTLYFVPEIMKIYSQNDKNVVKKLVMRSKNVSGCQQNASCCQNVPGSKWSFVTYKIRHNVINTSWCQKVRHDVKKFVITSKNLTWRKTDIMMSHS